MKRFQLIGVGLPLLLAACGGGGDGGSSPAPPGINIAVNIETETGYAYDPRIVADSSGNATVVWVQQDAAGDGHLYSSRYDAGTGAWATTGPIDDQPTEVFDPDLAIDLSGNVVAAWCQWDGPHVGVYANRYDVTAGQWEADAKPIGNVTGDAQRPKIAIDPAGNVMVVWKVYDTVSHTYSIYANRYDARPGGGWGTADLIETETGGATDPSVDVDAAGNAIAVWTQSVGTDILLYANRYDAAAGRWGLTGKAIETDAGGSWYSEVAFDPSGNAVAVWSKHDGTSYNVLFNRYDATTGWGAKALPIEDGLDDTYNPDIAFDSAGNALAVWVQSDPTGATSSIQYSRYDAASDTWGTPGLIATPAASPYFNFAMAPDDTAVLVWSVGADVLVQRYDPATGWNPAKPVESNAGMAYVPYVAIGAGNRAVAVWEQEDSTGNTDIWAYREE